MPIYALSVILMLMVLEMTNTKMVAYADDFSAAGSISNLNCCWDTLCELNLKFGYFPESTKSWLTVKLECSDKAIHIFKDTYIQTATQGKKHLGAALSTSQFIDEYIMEKIKKWVEELHALDEIAKRDPQTAYICFLSGYKHKFNYYMRKIPAIGNLFRKVDEVILNELIPAITGGIIITENDRKLLSLAPQFGGLGTLIFEELCEIEYQSSIKISEHLCNRITDQSKRHEPEPELNNNKKQIKSMKIDQQKKILEMIRNRMSPEERK